MLGFNPQLNDAVRLLGVSCASLCEISHFGRPNTIFDIEALYVGSFSAMRARSCMQQGAGFSTRLEYVNSVRTEFVVYSFSQVEEPLTIFYIITTHAPVLTCCWLVYRAYRCVGLGCH